MLCSCRETVAENDGTRWTIGDDAGSKPIKYF